LYTLQEEYSVRTRIGRWGNSAGARFPKEALEASGIAIGTDVEIVARSGVIELRKPRRFRTLDELFAEAEAKGPLEPPATVDWGPDRGAEIIDDDWSDIAPTDDEMTPYGGR
jgi:antitoxin MazE